MLTCTVDTSKLEKALNEAGKFSSRTVEEQVDQTMYFVAKGALYNTYAAPKEKITESLMESANVNGSAPKASILVNYWRGKKGLKGLNGQDMAIATEKFIRVQVSHRNFARSGWVGAVKQLAPFVKSKAGGPKTAQGVRLKINNSGGAIPAHYVNGKASAKIFNSISGKDNQSTVERYQKEGLAKAVENETNSKMEHVAAKKLEDGFISIFR